MSERPLILFTNDDGIQSPGLLAVVQAFKGLGERLVVAPKEQQSGMGRSLPISSSGRITPYDEMSDDDLTAFAVEGTPAQTVQHGVMELAPRRPDLVVSGINYGENTGNGVTISGTVGAAIEAASMNIPAIAISQQTPHNLHLSYSRAVDFNIAAEFARFFAVWFLNTKDRDTDIDLLKIDLPEGVRRDTPWHVTRLSKARVYWPTLPDRSAPYENTKMGYAYNLDMATVEPDSDVHTLFQKKEITITPISIDMTSRVDLEILRESFLNNGKFD